MKRNVKRKTAPLYTHEGGPAKVITATQQLRRLVLSCLLWEDTFYVDGVTIADQIVAASKAEDVVTVMKLAFEARNSFHLRHVPLLLVVSALERLSGKAGSADAVAAVLQRPDELGELLALYWELNPKQGKRSIPHVLKKAFDKAIRQFDAYQLGKYARQGGVRLRDILRLTHPKPANDDVAGLWTKLAKDTLTADDSGTWEARLSKGEDKKLVFTELLKEGKLGYLALLRNLRNMEGAGVDRDLVEYSIVALRGSRRVFPFRFVAAARATPSFAPVIDQALKTFVSNGRQFDGRTLILVDVSGSMDAPLSGKSDLKRMDAAAAVGACFPGKARVFSFSNTPKEVANYGGLAGIEAIVNSQPHGGTYLGGSLGHLDYGDGYDRLIVITDEQAHDRVNDPKTKFAYMVNVASYKNGVGYGKWTHIDGFSEAIFRFMHEHEASE